jgi:hypothetical protein
MATFLGAPTLLVFGRFDVRTPAKFTALALLKLLFRQFQSSTLSIWWREEGVGYDHRQSATER